MTGVGHRADRLGRQWVEAKAEVVEARLALAVAPEGIARQLPYERLVAGERGCTDTVHAWLADALEMAPVDEPRLVLSLDVDGVLEDQEEGFSCTTVAGAAALRLLQLGRVGVVLNTGRSTREVRARVAQFKLLGGVASFGAGVWDGVFGRERSLLTSSAAAAFERLRTALRADPGIVLDMTHRDTVRASRIIDRSPGPIAGPVARQLLDQHALHALTFWVAPWHTDFVDRRLDKASGLLQLLGELSLDKLPLAAMGDATCDLPMLRLAAFAFLPAGTLPRYAPMRRQRLLRSRYLGDRALWAVACHLVQDGGLERQVLGAAERLNFPAWFPASRRRHPTAARGVLPAAATVLATVQGDD